MIKDIDRTGLLYAFTAYFMWGVMPLYWKQLDHISSSEILAWRIFGAFFFMLPVIFLTGRREDFLRAVRDRKMLARIAVVALVISINWGTFIYAINSGHVIETSLGYYINPLVYVFIGLVFFREKLNRYQKYALALALCGVLTLTFQYGRFPWISFVLAFSFAFYGTLKKVLDIDPLAGLLVEMMCVSPFALWYLVSSGSIMPGGTLTASFHDGFFLLCAGMVTALPLMFFGRSTKLIPLTAVGFMQYLAPTMTLMLGIFVFRESFTSANFMGFSMVWTALGFYFYSLTDSARGRGA